MGNRWERFFTFTQLVFWAVSSLLVLEAAVEAKNRNEAWVLGAMFGVLLCCGPTVLYLFWCEWKTYLLDRR